MKKLSLVDGGKEITSKPAPKPEAARSMAQAWRIKQLFALGVPYAWPPGKYSVTDLTRGEADIMIANMEQRILLRDREAAAR